MTRRYNHDSQHEFIFLKTMKMNNIYRVLSCISLLGTALFVTSCNNEDNIVERHLKLDTYAHSFTSDDESHLVVNVTSTSDWAYELAGESWIGVHELTDNRITFYAEPNTAGEERQAVVTFTNADDMAVELRLTQLGSLSARFFKIENGLSIVMSSRGNYVAYMEETIEDEMYDIFGYYVVLNNLEEGESSKTYVGNQRTSVLAVSDNGIVILENDEVNHGLYLKEGTVYPIEVPAGYSAAYLSSISGDGNTMVGYYQSGGLFSSVNVPVKWVGGVPTVLEKPALNVDGTGVMQIRPRGCSEDGSVIFGTLWDMPNFQAVYWKEDNKIHYVAEDLISLTEQEPWYSEWEDRWITDVSIEGVAGNVTTTWISPDGRYLALRFQKMPFIDNGWYELNYHPLFYDLQEGVVVAELSGIDGGGTAITNEGWGFYATPDTGSQSGYAYDINTGVTKSSSQWIFDTFAIDVPESIVQYAGKDGKSALGYMLRDYVYQYWYINNY